MFTVIYVSVGFVILSPANSNVTLKPSIAWNSNKPESLVFKSVLVSLIVAIIVAFAIESARASYNNPVIKPAPSTEMILINESSITVMLYSALTASYSTGISLNSTFTLYCPLVNVKSAVAVPFPSVASGYTASPIVMVTLAFAIPSPM